MRKLHPGPLSKTRLRLVSTSPTASGPAADTHVLPNAFIQDTGPYLSKRDRSVAMEPLTKPQLWWTSGNPASPGISCRTASVDVMASLPCQSGFPRP